MKHYAQYDENSKLIAIGMGNGGEEIAEAQYKELMAIILTKAELVNSLYAGEITIDDVPVEWQEEIQRRVDERIAWEKERAETAEATESDYQDALREMGVEV